MDIAMERKQTFGDLRFQYEMRKKGKERTNEREEKNVLYSSLFSASFANIFMHIIEYTERNRKYFVGTGDTHKKRDRKKEKCFLFIMKKKTLSLFHL
jgi:hypothetical protein